METPDHDHSKTGIKILPSGYCFFFKNSEEKGVVEDIGPEWRIPVVQAAVYKDDRGVLRASLPRGVQLFMRSRANFFDTLSASNHLMDRLEVCKIRFGDSYERLSDFLAKTDGGHDFDAESIRVIYLFGKLWLSTKSGTLMHIFHAPGHSYLNEIERFFHFLNKIDGATIPAMYGGDTLPPNKQTDLTDAQILHKNLRIARAADTFLTTEWSEISIRGTPVDHKFVYPQTPNVRLPAKAH